MSLRNLLNRDTTPRWTESEIEAWVNTLPDDKQRIFVDTLKKAESRGIVLLPFACRLRARLEAEDRRNTPTWVDTLSAATIGLALGGVINGNKKL